MILSERERDRISRRAAKDVLPRRTYSFARAGDLWLPKHCIGGGACGSFAARGQANATSSTPLDWPGAANLEAWYHWRFDRQYNSTLSPIGAGASHPTVDFTGTVGFGVGLKIEITSAGTQTTAIFRWSARNGDGTDWVSGVTAGASVNLGNGITLVFAPGSYATNHAYTMTASSFRDQTGHGHHFTASGADRQPIPLVTPYGTALCFNSTADAAVDNLACIDTLGTNIVGGSDHAFVAYLVFILDSTTTASGTGCFLFFGDGATNRSLFIAHHDAADWAIVKRGNGDGSFTTVSGGTPTTGIHVMQVVHTGTTAQILIDGTSVVGPTAQDKDTLTVTTTVLAASALSGAIASPVKASFLEVALYNDDLDATTRADLNSRYRAGYGF